MNQLKWRRKTQRRVLAALLSLLLIFQTAGVYAEDTDPVETITAAVETIEEKNEEPAVETAAPEANPVIPETNPPEEKTPAEEPETAETAAADQASQAEETNTPAEGPETAETATADQTSQPEETNTPAENSETTEENAETATGDDEIPEGNTEPPADSGETTETEDTAPEEPAAAAEPTPIIDTSESITMFQMGFVPRPRWFEGTLVHYGPDYTVTAVIGQDAQLPADIVMRVAEILPGTEIYEFYREIMADTLEEDEEMGEFARLFDIAFVTVTDGEETEIEPLVDIDVQITFLEAIAVSEETDVQAVHFEENTPEIMDVVTDSLAAAANDDEAIDTLSFSSGSFSVYGFFQKVKKVIKVITASGETFAIDVTFTSDSGIPDDAELTATEITPDDPVYEAYKAQALRALDAGEAGKAFFFDIRISKDGEKIEPTGPVTVVIALDEMPEEKETVAVVHFGEEATEVIDSVEVSESDIQFQAESFSVFGVITEPGDNSLNGKTALIRQNGLYMDSTMLNGVNPQTIRGTNREFEAAEYCFVSTGETGKYYIYTVDPDTQEMKYLNFNYRSGQMQSHAFLSSTPQEFRVEQAGNRYRISQPVDRLNMYLDVQDGGFRARIPWSTENTPPDVELDFIQGDEQSTTRYVVIIKRDNQYYTVQPDGTLVPCVYHEDTNLVEMESPVMWTYSSVNGGSNLKISEEALEFSANQLPTRFSYRYINPNDDDGITVEEIRQYGNYHYAVSEAENSALRYENHTLHGTGNNSGHYIGVTEELGKLKISGNANASSAAEVYLAVPMLPSSAYGRTNAVNHIDVSVSGVANLNMAFAYGTYYDADGNEIVIDKDNPYTYEVSNYPIGIKQEDMVRSEITAYKVNSDGSQTPLNDMFYVTGYSNNGANDGPTDSDQVRIEGFFKVSYTDVPGRNGDATSRQARLNTPVYYTVTAPKSVTVPLKYNGKAVYAENPRTNPGAQPLEATTTVMLSASFTYWDLNNACPACQDNYGGTWHEWTWWGGDRLVGDIPDGPSYDKYHAGSGMDFVLKYTGDSGTIAVEVVKYVVDEHGNPIQVASEPKYSFDIYYSRDKDANYVQDYYGESSQAVLDSLDLDSYTKLHTKNIMVGPNGSGVLYDYDAGALVSDNSYAMMYIKEDPQSIPKTIVDQNGETWEYTGRTRIETEYVTRQHSHPDHEVQGYTAFPEVIGRFHYLTQSQGHGAGQYKTSSFLEFHVYNEYTNNKAEVQITKYLVDESGNVINPMTPVENTFYLYRNDAAGQDSVKDVNKGSYTDPYDTSGYTTQANLVDTVQTTVNTSGWGMTYEDAISGRMYTIREDPDTIPDQIVDTQGYIWNYTGTEILTEYVWRKNGDEGQRHYSTTFTKGNGNYTAVPEILGTYLGDDGAENFNAFLDFFVYNKYVKTENKVESSKMNLQLNKLWNKNGDTTPLNSGSVTFRLHQVKTTTTAQQQDDPDPAQSYTINLRYGNGNLASSVEWDGRSPVHLTFRTKTTYEYLHLFYNAPNNWNDDFSAQSDGNRNYSEDISIDRSKADQNGVINIYFSINANDFDTRPRLSVTNGSGSSSGGETITTATTELDPMGSGFPKDITLTPAEWSALEENLLAQVVRENSTTDYSYYLEEISRTGKAASYPIVMYEDGLGSDMEHAVSGSGNHTVSVTNIYDSTIPDDKMMAIQKIWKDQNGDPLVIHPTEITVKIYRVKLPGTASSSGSIIFNSVGGPYDVIGQPTTWQDNGNEILNDVVFYYNGHYYYVRAGQFIFNRGQLQQWVAQLDRGEMEGDHTTRLTGNVWTLEEVKEKARNNIQIERGDLCYYNGDYWVFRHTSGAFGSTGHTWGPDVDGNWSKVGKGNILTGVTIDLMPNDQYLTEDTIRNQTIPELYAYIDQQLAESGTGITWSDEDKTLELYRDNVVITEDMDWESVFRVDTGYLYFVFEDPIPGYTTTYGYEEYGVYDQEHSIEIVNTTTRGELDVTKTWAGENSADRIYFIVQQNGLDEITVDIAETPANYGLTTDDVFAQEAGNYLILTKGGDGWNTLRIKNLMLADYKPKPEDNIPYEYTVQEIGYHDAYGDHWNVSNILSGYSMSEQGGEETYAAAGSEMNGVELGTTASTITIHNETPTDFSFTKTWKKNDVIQPWKESATIEVTLNAYTDAAGPDVKALDDSTYTLDPDGDDDWTAVVNDDGSVTFTIENLKAFDDSGNALTYYVTETEISGYTTTYAAADGQTVENGDRALNGQQIINTEYMIDIRVIKQNAETGERMTGAEFRLDRKNDEGTFETLQAAAPVDDDGVLVFEELPDGEYRITETKAPAGFMPLGSAIRFTIENGRVSYDAENGSILVTYTEATDTDPDTFTVDNKPGKALPSTGGSGTAPYILTGIALMVFAGILLLDRKRKAHK